MRGWSRWIGKFLGGDPLPFFELRPHRLSIDLWTTFKAPFDESHARLAVFTNLTHLDLADGYCSWKHVEGIQYLPRLTHFAADGDSLTLDLDSIIQGAITHCERLAIIVLYEIPLNKHEDSGGKVAFERPLRRTIKSIGDPRIVCVERAYLKEWFVDVQGGRSMWTVAEEIVERRRTSGM
ncbi:hypothetical protein BDN72DRAFT_126384 [Pluteus cervinus]|uniref:Uncharacterized protein n=1 Tax=Pluteus cervinus TaxID=181527 RepID=A0ACD3ALT1_9AGAR|nr:hypothetical protein BDN72DRAFT_126384 [Pluteus cervinus]